MRYDRAADDVRLPFARGGDHAGEPFGVRHFIVVDHEDVRRRSETAPRLREGAIAGAAIPGLRLDHAEAIQQGGGEEGVGDRRARLADRVVVDDDHGEPGLTGLIDQRLQRQAEHIGTSTRRHANDGLRRALRQADCRARWRVRDGPCIIGRSRILVHGGAYELRVSNNNPSNRAETICRACRPARPALRPPDLALRKFRSSC